MNHDQESKLRIKSIGSRLVKNLNLKQESRSVKNHYQE